MCHAEFIVQVIDLCSHAARSNHVTNLNHCLRVMDYTVTIHNASQANYERSPKGLLGNSRSAMMVSNFALVCFVHRVLHYKLRTNISPHVFTVDFESVCSNNINHTNRIMSYELYLLLVTLPW